MSRFVEREKDGVVYMTSPVITAKHAFTTRYGGVSEGYLSSLNLGFNRGDERERVMENYRILGRALDVDVMRAAYTKQVHGTNVRTVTDADRCCPTDPDPCDSDGLVTNVRGLALFCFTADCVPLLLHDPVSEVAGAVHCGWRSSVGDITAAAMRAMIKLGARARYTHAAIGPAIGACCFETDADVPEAVRRWLGDRDAAPFIREKGEGGKFLVDLRGALRCRLLQFGLEEKNIDVSDECTMCLHEKYWSHRYTHGERGSQCAVICL